MDDSLRFPITIIAAPPGFGKTAILAAWAAQTEIPFAWLALDAEDNAPIRFYTYLITALKQVFPDVGAESLALLQSPQTPTFQTVLTLLLAELNTCPADIALILDDYHFITAHEIHAGLTFLLEHLPRQMHLIIATRADPPLPLARLRAQGELNELRAADLRFNLTETAAFLNSSMALNLTDEEVQALEARTEGWIAGLQLAALSLRGQPDRGAFIRAFSGSHRHILDYLGAEVLARQPESVQQFLLKTSLLDRLCGPLCDALLQMQDSQTVLEALEQANLFLIPLDDERSWYRYHPLFADFLQARLRRMCSAAEIASLHQCAAAWCETNHFAIQAVNHALAAHDLEHAARIVEQNTLALLTNGELATLLNWITLLPAALVRERPWLCVEQAWTLAMAGQLENVAALLQTAEQHALQGGDADRLNGHVMTLRAYIALVTSQTTLAFELAQDASQILPPDEQWVRTVVEWIRGNVLRAQGNLIEAAQAFNEHVRLARACDNMWALLMGINELATIYRIQGQLTRAAGLFQEALDRLRARGAGIPGYVGRVEAGLASILYERNQLTEAHRLLLSSLEKQRLWQNPNYTVFSQVLLTRVFLAQGDRSGAHAVLAQAEKVEAPLAWVIKTFLERIQVRMWLLEGDSAALERWSQIQEAHPSENNESRELELITRARWLVYRGQPQAACLLLDGLVEPAERSGRLSLLLEILVLQALAHAARGDTSQAIMALEQALTRGEPDDFIRSFLDEGEPLRRLLSEYCTQRPEISPRLLAYAGRLLEAFRAEKIQPPAEQNPAAPKPARLPEPLSARELEILRGLAEGLSYQDIAARLVVAHGTVKVHVHTIYGKLGVANRTQAIGRARELGLL